MKKFLQRGLLLLLILVLSLTAFMWTRMGPGISGYAAKNMCSCVFVGGRLDTAKVFAEELHGYGFISYQIGWKEKSVTSHAMGAYEKKAIYREGLGCTLLAGRDESALRSQISLDKLTPPLYQPNKAWPMGDSTGINKLPPEVDSLKLMAAVNKVFLEGNPDKPKHSRAVIVVYKDQIIAEKYAEGFDAGTRQAGWSMTKSITHALFGILVKEGKLSVSQKSLSPSWTEEGDPRKEISINDLLHMSSGLDWSEEYTILGSEVVSMLFDKPSASAYSIDKSLAATPGSKWYYSSGTTNIVMRKIQEQFNNPYNYLNFPREALFNRIGMSSTIMEPDAGGSYVGSSFCMATPRDWARFGLLYLHDGVWMGERILPEGWVDYARTAAPAAPKGQYGAHWWLKPQVFAHDYATKEADLPDDLYFASGYEEQRIVIIPSRELVIVRLGQTVDRTAWDYPGFLAGILEAIE